MTLRLDSVMNCAVRLKGEGGPQIVVEMEYLPTLSKNRYKTKEGIIRYEVQKWMEQLAFMVRSLVNSGNLTFSLPVKILLTGEFPTRGHVDIHNCHIVVADAIEDGLGVNDRFYVFEDVQPTVTPSCEPKLIITIQEANQ